MTRTIPVLAALAALAAAPAHAADSWGLENERTLEVTGKVVDLLCELTGDCPAECGAGKRQLGILTAEGRLLPAVKGTVFFAGGAPDLESCHDLYGVEPLGERRTARDQCRRTSV